MMWMGLVSAWGAVVVGALFAALAALHLSWGDVNWLPVAAVQLLAGGVLTLRKMSGGLRTLAGAWGLAAGLTMLPYTLIRYVTPNESYSVDLGLLAYLIMALPWISLAGLALTVLHQERKYLSTVIRLRNTQQALVNIRCLLGRGDEGDRSMQVQKLRVQADEAGLVPAGHYFARLAKGLEDANAKEAARREALDAEDRELEALYRKRSASRANTYADAGMTM